MRFHKVMQLRLKCYNNHQTVPISDKGVSPVFIIASHTFQNTLTLRPPTFQLEKILGVRI